MVSLKIGNLTGVPAAGMSDLGRTGGGRVLAQCTGPLVDAGAGGPLNSGVVSSTGASALGYMAVVSDSLTECMRPTLGLTAAERSQEGSLTKLA